MRKLFWSCILGGVGMTAAVFATAHFAVGHPDSMVGKILYGTAQVTHSINPLVSLTSTLITKEGSQACPQGVEEPAEVYEPLDELVSCSETPSSAAIVIPEDEPIPPAPMPVLPDELCLMPSFQTLTASAAPAIMPYVEEESEPFEAEAELLHMPRRVEAGEEQEVEPVQVGGGVGKILGIFGKMLKHSRPSTEQPCPLLEPCPEPKSPCPRSTSQPHHEEEQSLLRRPFGLFRGTLLEQCLPIAPRVDTMEFRPADRSLSEYGFGPI